MGEVEWAVQNNETDLHAAAAELAPGMGQSLLRRVFWATASLVCSDASILEQLKLRSNEPSAALTLVKLLPASEALVVLTKSIDSGCHDPAIVAAAVGLAKQSNDLATAARMASLISSGGPLDAWSSERSAMVRQLLIVSGMSSNGGECAKGRTTNFVNGHE